MSIKMKVELLPNEIFIECFQYLYASDIMYSFDQLNYRFNKLIRNISLHLILRGFEESLCNIYKTMSIKSLMIDYRDLNDISQLLICTSMLKYLKVQHLFDSDITNGEWSFTNKNKFNLKQFIINHSVAKFKVLELLLHYMINLEMFSISAPSQIEMVDANRWQHLIEASPPRLHAF
ncbi:unnamed protein product [Rotaria magnacalcarata]|uniref:F-box domain-containing protein n=2 Tax=Rotaria magnacalcarata TaxID=392030 RepID=A0A816STU3_9BILA|nr:unnamed protein product [Rotaria magnacalcarata]